MRIRSLAIIAVASGITSWYCWSEMVYTATMAVSSIIFFAAVIGIAIESESWLAKRANDRMMKAFYLGEADRHKTSLDKRREEAVA